MIVLPNVLLAIFTATITIYIGCIVDVLDEKENLHGHDVNRSPTGSSSSDHHEVTFSQALIFPLYASGSLLVFFFFFDYIQYIILFFITFSAIVALYQLLITSMKLLFTSLRAYQMVFIAAVFTGFVTIEWIWTGSALFHDILGCALCIFFISALRFPSLKIATIALSLLLLYDAFWVFLSPYIFTKNVMVEVATKTASNPVSDVGNHLNIEFLKQVKSSIELPIKLIFPNLLDWEKGRSMMLGLGDIAIPGALVALGRRCDLAFDNILSTKSRDDLEGQFDGSNHVKQSRTLKLFHYALGSYSVSLLGAFVGNALSGHPQPALIYIVPGVLIPMTLRAYYCGRLQEIWAGHIKSANDSLSD